MNAAAVKALEQQSDVARALGEVAKERAKRVSAPSRFSVSTRAGVGPKGAFAQVIMRGGGAIGWEFGSIRNPPMSPLRTAVFGGRR
jgi:hypothetical protein